MSLIERLHKISDNTGLSVNTEVTTAKLEVTGKCTMHCPFCYNREMRKTGERQRYINDKEFYIMLNALDKLGTIKEVGLFYMGESTLHARLEQYYKILKKRGYYTYLTVNLFSYKYLIESIPWIDSLKISWNFRNYKDFEDSLPPGLIKPDGETDCRYLFRKHINLIKSIYEKCKFLKHKLCISSILRPGDTQESYRKYIDIIPHDEWYFLPLQSQGGYVEMDAKEGVVGEYNKQSSPLPCWSLFKGFYVDCNLNIRTCCYGHGKEHILMNLNDDEFTKEKYYSLKREYMEEQLLNKVPSICSKCLKQGG